MCDCSDLTPLLEKYRDRFKIEEEEGELGITLNWIWTHGEVTIEDIQDDVEGCPACTLAILRQTRIDEWPSPIRFDYQKARKEWWKDVNAAQEEDYHERSLVL